VEQLSVQDRLPDLLRLYSEVDRPVPDGRPWVLGNMVGGLDGSAAMNGRVGALSTPVDAALFRELRSVADVVLVGAETVRRERYGPVRLAEALRADRVRAGRPAAPPIAVVSRSLDIDWSIPLFAEAEPDARPLLVTCSASPEDRRLEAGKWADLLIAGEEAVDVAAALGQLRARGHQVLLCEGGPLDELCLTLSPLMGGDPLPLAITPAGGAVSRFALRHAVTAEDGTVFLRYERTS
jgi:riboflavin biosynthesis pyrimidine reductase